MSASSSSFQSLSKSPMSAPSAPPMSPTPGHDAERSLFPDFQSETSHAGSASANGVPSVAAIQGREPEPFRFLDLPPELRNMVYKAVDFTSHCYILPQIDPEGRSRWLARDDADKTITMICKAFSFDLLVTCEQIQEEARPIFEQKLGDLELEPVQFFLGYGAASIITVQAGSESTDSPLVHCFNVEKAPSHKPEDSEEMADFVARSSSFIKHCQSAKGKGHVELIVDTPDHTSGVHLAFEVWQAVEGAWSMAAGWCLPSEVELDVTFTFYKQLPECRDRQDDPLDTQFCSGKNILKTLRENFKSADYSNLCGNGRNFRFRKVKTAERWAKILKGRA